MSIGPRISLSSSNADRRNALTTGIPVASAPLADLLLPVGLLATVTDIGQSFEGDGLSFSLAPTSDPLPSGLSFDASAVLFGTPTDVAQRTLIIRASNTNGFVDSALVLATFDLEFLASIDGLTANPTYGASAETGVPLSAQASAFNGPPPGPESFQWKTIQTGDIAGANEFSYTPDAAIYDGESLFCTITAAPYPSTDSVASVIRHRPPVAAGGLSDEIFDINTGFQTIDASVDFTGVALSYSVDGAQATIDANGIVSIDTASALSGEVITVNAENSGGSATSQFIVTVEDPGSGVFDMTPTVTTQLVRGVSFTFDRAMPVGYSVIGDPIVIADQAFSITTTSPASGVGTLYVGNGMMKFEGDGSDAPTSDVTPIGFDETLQEVDSGSLAAAFDYDTSVNIDPAINGAISVAQGSRKVFVKAVRGSENATGSIDEYVTLTVLPSAPAKTVPFRPGAVYANQDIFGESDIDLSCLRSLAPPTGLPTVATALGNLSATGSARMFPRWTPNLQRRIEDQTTRNLGATQAYSADYAVARVFASYLLHANTLSNSDKLSLARPIIQFGLDVIAAEQANDDAFGAGAGQWHGYHTFAYFAAFLLRDSTLLSAAQSMGSNMAGHPRWITNSLEGLARSWPSGNIGGSNWNGRTYDATDIGKPDWTGAGGRNGSEVPATSGYKSISLPIGAQELLPILLLQDGPGGISGFDAFLQSGGGNGRYNTTNDRAAAIASMERWQTWKGLERGFNATYKTQDFYNDWIGNIHGQTTAIGGDTISAWSGVPDATEDEVITGGGDGSISYSYTGKEQATEIVTQYDFGHSLDNIQFIETPNVGPSGSKTGLLRGTLHYARMRLVSSSGNGKWTRTGHKVRTQDSSNRGEATTTGSEANAAPTFTTNPALYRKTYPLQNEPLYTVAESTLPIDTIRLYCGAGYSTGYPAPTYSFDWKRGGVSIGAPDQNSYEIDPVNDSAETITCTITATNSSGTSAYTTSGVTVGAGTSYPASVIFDSEFDTNFFLDWGNEYGDMYPQNGVLTWQPGETFSGEDYSVSGTGALIVNKTSSNPSILIPLSRSRLPNTEYRVTVRFINAYRGPAKGDNGVRMGIGSNWGLNEWETTYSSSIEEEVEIVQTFTTGGSVEDPVDFRIAHQQSTGGGSGADLALLGLKIEAV